MEWFKMNDKPILKNKTGSKMIDKPILQIKTGLKINV